MNLYKNLAATVLEVEAKGKGFVTKRHYLATKRMPSETVEKYHRTYSPVEKMIAKFNFKVSG